VTAFAHTANVSHYEGEENFEQMKNGGGVKTSFMHNTLCSVFLNSLYQLVPVMTVVYVSCNEIAEVVYIIWNKVVIKRIMEI